MCSFVHPLAVSYALGIANQWDASKQYSKNIYTCEHTQTHPQTHTLEWNVIESSGSRQWMRERKGERNWLPLSPSISQRINTIEMLQCLFHIFRKNMQHAHIHRHTHLHTHASPSLLIQGEKVMRCHHFPVLHLYLKYLARWCTCSSLVGMHGAPLHSMSLGFLI